MKRIFVLVAIVIAVVALTSARVSADTLTLEPAMDNTLYEFGGGETSNSAGQHIFAGTGFNTFIQKLKRAILWFDIAGQIPPDATIQSVRLELSVNKTRDDGPRPFFLHRISDSWTEGNSDTIGNEGIAGAATDGDATWTYRTYRNNDLRWVNPGGDFDAEISAETNIGLVGSTAVFESMTMTADVQAWLDSPETNFGWMLKGVEDPDDFWATRRFASADSETPADRPKLIIEFTSSEDLTCRTGGVDLGSGAAVDVLSVNGSFGDGSRVVDVALGEDLTIDMLASPSGPDPGPFVLYLWLGEPDDTTVTPLPKNLGSLCFGAPFTGTAPFRIWNNVGRTNRLGEPDFPSEAAPSNVISVPGGSDNAATATIQGIILDDGSAADAPASRTNAVVIRIQ